MKKHKFKIGRTLKKKYIGHRAIITKLTRNEQGTPCYEINNAYEVTERVLRQQYEFLK